MRAGKTWKELVKLAPKYIELGQVEHYLTGDDKDYPWEFASEVESGGSRRLDMDTSVWFRANHPSGLKFRWSFEIEFREANGKGHYMIDTDGCASVMEALCPTGKKLFKEYLGRCAKTVSEQGDKYEGVLKSQREIAATLERLSQIE